MKRIKPVKRYKFLRKGLKSEYGNCAWKIGKWKKHEGELVMCKAGFHACKNALNAFMNIQGEILAIVECRGEFLEDEDKECFREQRVLKAYKWTKKDSINLAIFSAELALPNFEKEYPDDMRPRVAIEAAKKVLLKDTEKNRKLAASAASSAALAAAYSAAFSAKSAAFLAASAALAAANSAASAASSAASAALAASSAAAIEKIQNYFETLVNELEEIETAKKEK